MSMCRHCGVEILDDATACPLCHGGLELGGEFATGYPDIVAKWRKVEFLRRILLFLSIVAAALCIFIDWHLGDGLFFSILATGGIICGLIVLFVLTDPAAGYRKRSTFIFAAAVVYVLVIDIATGFHGWSVNYVLPGGLFFINFGLILLMIVNRRNWQSYMVYQIAGILIGIVPIIMIYAGIVTVPIFSELAFGSSVLLFLGTLIFGGREARTELSRRFHI